MLVIPNAALERGIDIDRIVADSALSLEDRARLSIIADLIALKWDVRFRGQEVVLNPPDVYTKDVVRSSMSVKRKELLDRDREWIDRHIEFARRNLARGADAVASRVNPVIEVCHSREQRTLFRMYRYYWSSPTSEYVGRRIRLLVRDAAVPSQPVIGIAALGSSIIHVPERDAFVGWTVAERSQNIIKTMDAYVVGALPPYNHLLGGKLIALILASNEIRKLFESKYADVVTKIRGRSDNALAALFTTSLYGRSSQYNRLRYRGEALWRHIGFTKGFGTLHLSERTFSLLKAVAKSGTGIPNYSFGGGPSWRVRVIRQAARCLEIDSDFLLRHSFRRGIYFSPSCSNWKMVLQSSTEDPLYDDRPLSSLTSLWRDRWLSMRKSNEEIRRRVLDFEPEQFTV